MIESSQLYFVSFTGIGRGHYSKFNIGFAFLYSLLLNMLALIEGSKLAVRWVSTDIVNKTLRAKAQCTNFAFINIFFNIHAIEIFNRNA